MPPRRSGEEERDQLLSADYRRRCDPLCTLVQLKQQRHNTEPAPPAYGRYVALRAEVPEEDMEWYIEGPNGDLMEHFGFSPPRGSACWSRRQRKEEEYMERVRRGVLRGGYVEEPRRSRVDFEERFGCGSRGNPRGTPVGTSVNLETRVHSFQGRRRRCVGAEGHQAPHVGWEPPQPRPLPGEATRLDDDRH